MDPTLENQALSPGFDPILNFVSASCRTDQNKIWLQVGVQAMRHRYFKIGNVLCCIVSDIHFYV